MIVSIASYSMATIEWGTNPPVSGLGGDAEPVPTRLSTTTT
jgi:hypothetical protein